jgi:1,4-dihydroxy-2-naphthoyl-CoA hydrolase
MTENHEDVADQANAVKGGFNTALGLDFVRVTTEEVIAEVKVRPEHLQPYGLVHGGVYAAMIETLCSTGAAINALGRGQTTVGQENATSFIRAVRGGTLRGRATPLTRGRRSHLWEARIDDDQGRLVAVGRVRLLCLEAGAEAGGEEVKLIAGSGE